MNQTVRSAPSPQSSGPVSDLEPAFETEDSPAGLFLVWSSAGVASEGEVDAVENWAATQAMVPARSNSRDHGLWLLRDTLLRRKGWLRLNAEQAASLSPGESVLWGGYAIGKRVLDVAGALVLLALLAPLFLLAAVLIRLDSPGPAFFRQRRVGKDGSEFLMWKFRSMCTDAPPYAVSPTSTIDARLTRVGRLMRRVSMDELPQLINVLRGEMSLVGPRPEMPFIVDGYTEVERGRLAMKPGITGLWQISPARAFPIHENVQYDLHYIRHRNLVLDGAILLRTVAAVIRGVGAV
jgi:lipopolysaccharide/colanic/teichoic acid biosynthesis glycosyltransferase